jgi:hypothetical protein
MTDKQEFFGLTAGYVLKGTGPGLTITHRVTRQRVAARVVVRPAQFATGFDSEVGILKIDGTDRKLMDTRNSRFGMYSYYKNVHTADGTDINKMNLDSTRVRSFSLASKQRLFVHKDGATTGSTMGTLMGIRHQYLPCWGNADPTQYTLDENARARFSQLRWCCKKLFPNVRPVRRRDLLGREEPMTL